MEHQVLYEASLKIDFALFIPPLMLVIFAVILIRQSRALKRGEQKARKSVIFAAICLGFMLLVMALVIPDQIMMYQSTVGAYKRGEYQVVEGYVENFHPMPAAGHDTERFSIEGVEFRYSDYIVQFGYHNARSHGGVITGDGQHLKIGYTQYRSHGNVIVYIEELP